MMHPVNIGLQVTKSTGERTSIVTNNVEEIRRVIDNLKAECDVATAEPEISVVVAAADMMPYGEGYMSMDEGTFFKRPVDTSQVANYTPPAKSESEGIIMQQAMQMLAQTGDPKKVATSLATATFTAQEIYNRIKDISPHQRFHDSVQNNNVENQLNEDWGQTNTSMAFQMMDGEIDSTHEGARNPGTIYSAAESAANLYADHMGFSIEEAIDWLTALYTEKHMGMGGDEEFDLSGATPDDVFSDMPGMPGTNMMDDPMSMEDPMMDPMGMEDPLGDMTSNDMEASAPEPDLGMGMMEDGSKSFGNAINKAEKGRQKALAKGRKLRAKGHSDQSIKNQTGLEDWEMKSLDEDADYDHRDEENDVKDADDYDRETDLMDFARAGHSKRPLKRGGLGDNRMAEPDEVFESQMASDWDKFKDSKKR